jgi:replicative DNA helicase
VDYLQLLKAPARSGPEERREAVVAEFARFLKETAVSEGVVMMVLSQLNDDGRLRESRAIGQHADVVVLISQTGDDSILRIEKHRNGPCGAAVARFCGERFCFEPKQAGKSASDRVRH